MLTPWWAISVTISPKIPDPNAQKALETWSKRLKRRFGTQIYLVGSALHKSDPRDYDVRVLLSKSRFAALYGDEDQWIEEGRSGHWSGMRWRWSADCVKYARSAALATDLNVDFQVYPPKYWRKFAKLPRIRLF